MTITDKKTERRALQFVLLMAVAASLPWYHAEAQPFRETKLVAPDGADLDGFGAYVALSGDWIAVGAPRHSDLGQSAGAVYMFRRVGDTWRFTQELNAGDGGQFHYFSAVSMDGDYLVVGAGGALHNGIRSGAAYVFKRAAGTWMQTEKIGPSPAVAAAWFGQSVCLRGDYICIGAYSDVEAGLQSGVSYVFVRNGEEWLQQARLFPSDAKERQFFGWTVSLWDSVMFVGAPRDSNANGTVAGAGYLFRRNGKVWTQTHKLVANNGLPEDAAGYVTIQANYAAIGAPGTVYVSRPGVAYVFKSQGSSWEQLQVIAASDGGSGNSFGGSIAITSRSLLVGAIGDNTQGVGAGAAYLFNLENTIWTEKHKLIASDGAAGSNYGSPTAIAETTFLIGAASTRVNGGIKGAAYVYEPRVVGVREIEPIPFGFQLYQNFPNPFNPKTEISWQIPSARWVTLSVYDLLGREVRVLVNEMKTVGAYSVVFDAQNLASGVYFYHLIAGPLHQRRRMLLIK